MTDGVGGSGADDDDDNNNNNNNKHYDELNDLYSSPNIVRVIKSRRMRWAGACGTYGGRERCAQDFGGET